MKLLVYGFFARRTLDESKQKTQFLKDRAFSPRLLCLVIIKAQPDGAMVERHGQQFAENRVQDHADAQKYARK